MPEETMQAAATTPAPVPEGTLGEKRLTVFARNPQEMAVAQARLIRWVYDKIDEVQRDHSDLQDNFDIATKNKWNYSAIGRQLAKAKKRLEFYEKVKAALEAGYCIVPSFPIDVFAVRTTKTTPAKNYSKSQYGVPSVADQESNSPALGEGENVSATAAVETDHTVIQKETAAPGNLYEAWATAFRDVDFPFAFAQPAVLDATQVAMASRIFDEIGVSPTRTNRRGDPMVIGRIYAPAPKWNRDNRSLSFVVAWFLRPDRDLNF